MLDDARPGAEVGGGDDRRVLGEVAAGVHPAPERLGLQLLDDLRADAEVLGRGLPGPQRVLGEGHALFGPGAQVVLGEGRSQLVERLAELLREGRAVGRELGLSLGYERIQTHASRIVAKLAERRVN